MWLFYCIILLSSFFLCLDFLRIHTRYSRPFIGIVKPPYFRWETLTWNWNWLGHQRWHFPYSFRFHFFNFYSEFAFMSPTAAVKLRPFHYTTTCSSPSTTGIKRNVGIISNRFQSSFIIVLNTACGTVRVAHFQTPAVEQKTSRNESRPFIHRHAGPTLCWVTGCPESTSHPRRKPFAAIQHRRQ